MKTCLWILISFVLALDTSYAARVDANSGLAPAALAKQRLYVSGGTRFIDVYANFSLTRPPSGIVRAIVIVHGAGRDADEYFRSTMAAAYLSGALHNTLIVAPRFAASGGECNDEVEQGELTWSCDTWKYGEAAQNDPTVNSFQVMDELLRTIESSEHFPKEAQVALAGHSAGGQYVIRYAIVNHVDASLRIRPTYFALNSSSYPYLDRFRPVPATELTRPNTNLIVDKRNVSSDAGPISLQEIKNANGCDGFDLWPYGLEARKGYAASESQQAIQQRFVDRHITLLVGQQDSVQLAGLDMSCPAAFQGANRLERAIEFTRYGHERYHVDHPLGIVPLCGHNARCMLTSPVTMPLMFAPVPNHSR